MPYIITGNVTFANQTQRDAAVTRVNTALSGLGLTPHATQFSAGLATPTVDTITFSYMDGSDGAAAGTIGTAILNALVASNRHTKGFLSVNKT